MDEQRVARRDAPGADGDGGGGVMRRLIGGVFLAGYAGSIVAANWLIDAYGLVGVGFGLLAPAGVWAAGASLALRDEVQDRLGKDGCVGAIAAGAAVSALLSPQLALASGIAFLVSEVADMAIYTPLRRRSWTGAVAVSNTVGAVVDSILFLWLAGIPLDFLAGNVVGKWWATLAILPLLWLIRRRRGDVLPGHAPARLAGGH